MIWSSGMMDLEVLALPPAILWQWLYITLHSHQSLLPIQCAMPGTPFKHAYTMCYAPIKHLSHGYNVVPSLPWIQGVMPGSPIKHLCHGYKVLCLAVPSNTFAIDTRCYIWQSHQTPLPWIQGVTPGSPIKHLCHGYKVLHMAVPSNTFATETRCYAWQSH